MMSPWNSISPTFCIVHGLFVINPKENNNWTENRNVAEWTTNELTSDYTVMLEKHNEKSRCHTIK